MYALADVQLKSYIHCFLFAKFHISKSRYAKQVLPSYSRMVPYFKILFNRYTMPLEKLCEKVLKEEIWLKRIIEENISC